MNSFRKQFDTKALYPWLVWLLASSFLFYKYLLQVSPSIMVSDLMREFSLTGASLGNLAAFYFYAYLCMQLPVGILLDRFNPRRLISTAVLVCAFGALIFGTAFHLSSAELGRLFIGLGGAFSAVGAMKLISMWFPAKRFALVSGMMMSVGMLGAVFGEAPLSYMVSNVGWRETMMLSALVGFVLAVLIWLLIKDKPNNAESTKILSLTQLKNDLLSIIKNKQSWFISIYSGLAFAPVSAFAGLWGVPFLMEKYGMHRDTAASIVSLVFIGFAIGSPLAGWFSDYIGRRKPIMILGTSLSCIILISVFYLPNMPIILLASSLLAFGFFTGFFFVSFATIREINPARMSGTSIGFINMFNAMFGALSQPLIGKLLDIGRHYKMIEGVREFSVYDYQVALLVLPVALLMALFLQLFIKETNCKTN